MIFGGAGVVIVIPMIQHMGTTHRAVTIVTVEAVVSDVFVILGVFTAAAALAFAGQTTQEFLLTFGQTFVVAIAVGFAFGFMWSNVLAFHPGESNEYIVTLAVLFLVYGATEVLGGSGPLSVLIFGLVLGNSRARRRVASIDPRPNQLHLMIPIGRAPVFGQQLISFHHEVVFFIRAFFFVCLGVVLDLEIFQDPRFLLGGILLALAVIASRAIGTFLVFSRSTLPAWDKLSIALMFPLGLIAAALSVIPYQQFGLAGTEHFPDYAAVVIVTTNILATLLVFAANLFLKDRLAPAPAAPAPTEA